MQSNADPAVADQLSALFALLSRSHVADGPVSRADYTLLVLVAKHGAQRACDLADAGGFDPSTTSRRVAALVDRGLLERTPDPDDRRAQRIALTEEGRAVLRHEKTRRVDLVRTALDGWDAADRRTLADLLARLQSSLAVLAGTTDHPVRSVAGPAQDAVPASHRERTPA